MCWASSVAIFVMTVSLSVACGLRRCDELSGTRLVFEMPDHVDETLAFVPADHGLAVHGELAPEIVVRHRVLAFTFRIQHAFFEASTIVQTDAHDTRAA